MKKYLPLGAVVFCVAFFSGCVTTEKSIFTEKADKQKALEASTQAAREYIRDRNWEAAKRHLRNAIEIDDNDPQVHEALAMVFQNTGEIELAEDHFKRAVSLDSHYARARYNYAGFLFSERRYSDAARQLEKVVEDKLYENRSSAFELLGLCYLSEERPKDAEHAFRRAFLMDRDNVILMYRMADVYYRLEDFAASKQYYDRFRQKAKVQPAQGLWLGIRLADKYNDENAMSSYALALKNLYPDSKEYLNYIREYGRDNK